MLTTFARDCRLDDETALKVAAAFGGGMGGMGEVCGSVTGALMAIGLKYGKAREGDQAAAATTERLVLEFVNRFRARHGSIICRELLGHPVYSREERNAARAKGLITVDCSVFIRDAAEILESLLEERDGSL